MKHERQTLIPGWDQDRLRNSTILIVGCGALGSSVALHATRVGIGHILLVDPDTIEEHNLENQCYDERDLGKPKVIALKERIEAIDSTILVDVFVARIEEVYAPIKPDAIFGCLDNVAARHFLNFVAVRDATVLIDGGIDGLRGQVKTVVPGTSACQSCYPMLHETARRASCSSNPVPSTYVIASIVAGLQVNQFLKKILRKDFHSYVQVDLERDVIHRSSFQPNSDCEVCGSLERPLLAS
jgi:molybdopterin-synthase adenylyltransferase